ncbi:MAG: hypothetical protein L0191_16900 [Acidobacteria bacterium]|nr:hypothetical protein [Acidobacteriota bacterium]
MNNELLLGITCFLTAVYSGVAHFRLVAALQRRGILHRKGARRYMPGTLDALPLYPQFQYFTHPAARSLGLDILAISQVVSLAIAVLSLILVTSHKG